MMLKKLLILVVISLNIRVSNCQNPTVADILNDMEIDSMTYFVQQLTGVEQIRIKGTPDTIHSRYMNHPDNEKAYQFIKEKLVGYGLQVDSLQFSVTGKNVMASKLGSKFPNRVFILGAHYDNVVEAGADDNASGTAVVIEAARVLSKYSFPFTVIFALWDEEEQGLVGSRAYASFAGSYDNTILGYINIDMLGWDGNNDSIVELNVRQIGSSLGLANKAVLANTTYNINLVIRTRNPGTNSSDHASFWNEGYTAIGINEEYIGDSNPYWHTPADSLGQFNLKFYERSAKLAIATLSECALDSVVTLGLEPFLTSSTISIYPNPTSDIVYIDYPGGIDMVNIYNGLGTLVKTGKKDDSNRLSLNLNHLPDGLYFVKVFTESGNYLKNVIVNK